MTGDFDEASFARVAMTLGPYLEDVVFVGGWAYRLLRLHSLALVPDFAPLMTNDVDVAAPVRLPRRSQTLRQLLLDASFRESPSGDRNPPRTEYRLDDESGGYVQFVTPLTGSAHRRDGSPDATTRIQGVAAEKLRHIDLLLTAPWTVELTAARGYPVGPVPLPLRICNPVSYLAQKMLSLPKRSPARRGKDVLCIHDTFQAFGPALAQVRTLWLEQIVPHLHPRHAIRVQRLAHDLFADVSDTIRRATQIGLQVGRTVSAEGVWEVLQVGVERVFE